MGFLDLELLSQIALFERRLWGAAPTPLALPYPFRTSPWTRMDAERDKREARKILHLERYSPVIFRILMHGEVDKILLGKTIFSRLESYLSQNKKTFTSKRKHGTAVGIIEVQLFVGFR